MALIMLIAALALARPARAERVVASVLGSSRPAYALLGNESSKNDRTLINSETLNGVSINFCSDMCVSCVKDENEMNRTDNPVPPPPQVQ
jgi:hypothetical protein